MAKDYFHHHVREALIKDGWNITHDPYYLIVEDVTYPIDLGAEPTFAAEKAGQKIAVEVKSFLRDSIVNEFHGALGQYLNYDTNLPLQESDRIVILAINNTVYEFMKKTKVIVNSLTRFRVKLLIFDPEKLEIVQWINY
jgi:XisH protein